MAVTNIKTYQTFRGVDYSASPSVISEEHASDLLNMYVGEDGVMQKRPGWHVMHDFGDQINGIHYLHYMGYGILFIHAGTKLYGVTFRPHLKHFGDDAGNVPFYRFPGDKPNASHASYILRYTVGLVHPEAWELENMDVNGDGKVDENDADAILRMLVGMEPFATDGNGVLSSDYKVVKDEDGNDMELANEKSVSFVHEDKLYLLDGNGYYVIKPTYSSTTASGRTVKYVSAYKGSPVEGYIPTTGTNGHYEYDELNEEGTNTPGSAENPGVWEKPKANEARNLLQTKQMNTFTTDGIHKAFYLLENNCDIDKVEMYQRTRCHSEDGKDIPDPDGQESGVYYYWTYLWVTVDPSEYTVTQASENTPIQNDISYTTKIQFNTTPPVNYRGQVSIRVTYSPRKHSSDWAINKDRGYIEKATVVTRFGYFNDNRYWFAGNPDHPNMDLMSAVDDPTYIPNDGWTLIGSRQTAIIGYLHYGSELAILKEDNDLDATVYMRSARASEDGVIYFPVQQGAEGVGAVSKYAICALRDDPLFLTKQGVFAIEGTDASQERNIPNRSFFIDTKLRNEATKECCAVQYGNHLLIANPATKNCFVADARSTQSYNGSFVYDWCVWDNIPAKVFKVVGDYLFFGTQDGKLCRFNTDWTGMRKYADGGEFVSGSQSYEGADPYSDGEAITAYYVTKRDHLGSLDFKKTILGDGGVVTLMPYEQSSAQLLIKTEKGEWFVDDIQTDSDEPSVVIPIRKRVKWFDSIQTRIENDRVNEGLAILGVQYRYALTTNRR